MPRRRRKDRGWDDAPCGGGPSDRYDRMPILTGLGYVWPTELGLMARLAGLRLRDRWADWDRAPVTETSGSHVSVWVTD